MQQRGKWDLGGELDMGGGRVLFCDDTILGEGGQGVVFRGRLREESGAGAVVEKEVAIKCEFARKRHSYQQSAERIERWGSIPEHENVLRLFAGKVLPEGRSVYSCVAVTEVMDKNLREFVYEDNDFAGTCTSGHILGILTQICRGLAHLHENEIIHYDIKPENILVSRRNGEFVVKVADFDCSKWITSGKKSVTASKRGSIFYMPPEVCALGPFRDPSYRFTCALDVYCLGAVMWEVLNRTPPHQMPEYRRGVGREICWGLLGGNGKVWCWAPELMCRVVEQCLSFRSLQESSCDQGRPTVREVLRELEKIKDCEISRQWALDMYHLALTTGKHQMKYSHFSTSIAFILSITRKKMHLQGLSKLLYSPASAAAEIYGNTAGILTL